MGVFLDYDDWDHENPGEKFEINFTYAQWSIVKYLAYMAFREQSDNGEIEDPEMIEKFIKKLIENEYLDPQLQGPQVTQQKLNFNG